jgi:L-amino acid N-acyltransferase YncA
MEARLATPSDAGAIARIYNQGIEDRIATFETRWRSEEDVKAWFDGAHPIVVVEKGRRVVAFAATFSYRPRFPRTPPVAHSSARWVFGRSAPTKSTRGLTECGATSSSSSG